MALFYPSRSEFISATAWYVDGNKIYETDGQTNMLDNGAYVSATQIRYDDYKTKQSP